MHLNHIITKENLGILKNVIIIFLGVRLALLFITFMGLGALPNINFYTKELFFPKPELSYWSRWANWDGKAYQDIALTGYEPVLTVFFPFYSILIKTLTLVGISSFWAGFLISNTATILAMFFLFKLILLDFKESIAKKAILALIIFPTSFYLVSLYNESLALFTIVAAFYFTRKKKWGWAAIFAGFASITRLTGLAAIIGIFFEYLINQDSLKNSLKINLFWKSKINRLFLYLFGLIILLNLFLGFSSNTLVTGIISTLLDLVSWVFYLVFIILLLKFCRIFIRLVNIGNIFSKNFLILSLSLLPVFFYLVFQKMNFGDFFSFLNHESIWGKYLSLPWVGPLNNLQFLVSNLFTIGEYSSRIHLRFGIFILSLIGLYFSFLKLRLSYTLFYFIALLIPLFSGTLIDFPRYALILFPLFIILGKIENEAIQKVGLTVSISLLTLLTILFFNGYFFM